MFCKLIILCSFFGIIFVDSAVQKKRAINCTTSEQCILLHDCEILQKAIHRPQSRAYVQRKICGWVQMETKVCCPLPSTTTSTTAITTSTTDYPVTENPCTTLENREGSCVALRSCPAIKRVVTKEISFKTWVYLKRTRCAGPDPISVCCDLGVLSRIQPGQVSCPSSYFPQYPNCHLCGKEINGGPKISGGTATSIYQYPWMAIIKYNSSHQCAGSLISDRHVLTAAHCLQDSLKPVAVILGEYNTTKDGKDCMEVAGGGEECTDGAIQVFIANKTIHEKYSRGKHDIALIKLNTSVKFTDFIKPICLPTSDIIARHIGGGTNLTFSVSGWGALKGGWKGHNIKMEADLKFVQKKKCRQLYKNVPIHDGHICAGGGSSKKDICHGDSGGPLMYEDEDVYTIIGVASSGTNVCGIEKYPSFFTNVYHYKEWVKETLQKMV